MNLRQFKIRNVAVPHGISAAIGFGMFGALSFLPVYFQVVLGNSSTQSGLKMIPLMLGLIVTSIICGGIITKTGHFYIFPVIGCTLITLGYGLLITLTRHTHIGVVEVFITLIGFGIGAIMQPIIVIIQSSVDRTMLATVTATSSFVRSMGAVAGVTLFGALLNVGLEAKLPHALQQAAQGGKPTIHLLPLDQQNEVLDAYIASLKYIWIASVPVGVIALGLALAVKNKKLERTRSVSVVKEGEESPPVAPAAVEV